MAETKSCRYLQNKIDRARTILERLKDGKFKKTKDSMRIIESAIIDLTNTELDYNLDTGALIIQESQGELSRINSKKQCQQIIMTENYVGKVNNIVQSVKNIPINNIKRRDQNLESILALIEDYFQSDNGTSSITVQDYMNCSDCNYEMSVNSDRSELFCPLCGVIQELLGTVFDDTQFYNQEGQKTKSGTFNPNRHFKFWMMHILAQEPEEEIGNKNDPSDIFGQKLIKKLSNIIHREKKILMLINVYDMRKMLKSIGRTDLNKNIPLILKKLTGVGPPHPPIEYCRKVEKIFSMAIEIREQVRGADRTNRNYYPFYIYKIFEDTIPKTDIESRRILYYIYLQGETTLRKNDAEWKLICDKMPDGIKFVDTDRFAAHKYAQNYTK